MRVATRAVGALLLAVSLPVLAQSVEGVVRQVSDGDTLVLQTGEGQLMRVRLAGIDAPEKSQPFGEAAMQALRGRVELQSVRVELRKQDRYGRWVGQLRRDARDINLELLEAGLAWHYKAYEDEQSPAERRRYAQAEDRARADGRGLWAASNPVAPWDHRKARRAAASADQPVAQTVFAPVAAQSAPHHQGSDWPR